MRKIHNIPGDAFPLDICFGVRGRFNNLLHGFHRRMMALGTGLSIWRLSDAFNAGFDGFEVMMDKFGQPVTDIMGHHLQLNLTGILSNLQTMSLLSFKGKQKAVVNIYYLATTLTSYGREVMGDIEEMKKSHYPQLQIKFNAIL